MYYGFLAVVMQRILPTTCDLELKVIEITPRLVFYSRLWNRRSPWNNRSLPFKNISSHDFNTFYINLGIAVILEKKFSSKFFKN
jgi:hypothetical protein